jgi:hypothetical protein
MSKPDAAQKAEETLQARLLRTLRTPDKGGWATDPSFNERRLVAMSRATLSRLKRLAATYSRLTGLAVAPMTLAAVLLDRAAEQVQTEVTDDAE